MRLFAFSDLHLGDGSKSDDFGRAWYREGTNDIKFIGKLAEIAEDVDEMIALGDIFECHQFKMKDIRKAHPAVVSFIEKSCRYIRGNHDYGLTGSLTHTVRGPRGSVLFSHGFQNDKFMTSPVSRVGCWLLKWVEKILPDVDAPERWKGIFTRKRNRESGIDKKTRQYARSFVGKHRGVVCGHTHKPKITTNGLIYANTGACTHGRFEGVFLDTEDMIFTAVKL